MADVGGNVSVVQVNCLSFLRKTKHLLFSTLFSKFHRIRSSSPNHNVVISQPNSDTSGVIIYYALYIYYLLKMYFRHTEFKFRGIIVTDFYEAVVGMR